MKKETVSCMLGGRSITLETGYLAKQASGAVVVRYGDSTVLVTCVVSEEAKVGSDFFPLTVDYVEKTFAAGKIPGGFFKREGRLSERETLTSRFIDRPIRPLFEKGFFNEVQIIATVLSLDPEHDTDSLAMIGASAALCLSPAPFLGPIGGVRICRVDGQFIVNPGYPLLEKSDLNLIVAGSQDAIMMVEGGGAEVSEADMIEAISLAHKEIQAVLKIQNELADRCGKAKLQFEPVMIDEGVKTQVREVLYGKLVEALSIPQKIERYTAKKAAKKAAIDKFTDSEWAADAAKIVSTLSEEWEEEIIRNTIISKQTRIDARKCDEIRPIFSEVGVLPRTHGSGLFTRGETQALVTTTLGTNQDMQIVDNIIQDYKKKFMLHYNFPPFCVGEAKFLRGPGRREIGHGALAERAIGYVLPSPDDFPYTIRIVSEILESNGSSSMASVCGSSLSLMDAGVPIKAPIAGIAMGLIKEEDKVVILSDILGDEDHVGDMDFKVAGSEKGITALQMDIKVAGVDREILEKALEQARVGRLHILREMGKTISEPRKEISNYAPRILTLFINPAKIGAVIGPGGKVIKGIVEKSGAKVDIEDSGKINISSPDVSKCEIAIKMINELTEEAEVGKIYMGTVVRITDFGAFVEILPGTEGLVHISHIAHYRVNKVTDEIKEGDEIAVKVIDIDRSGKIRLSRKEAMKS
jgi:polyribonucleotide nucleotidyltransferase